MNLFVSSVEIPILQQTDFLLLILKNMFVHTKYVCTCMYVHSKGFILYNNEVECLDCII